MYVCMEASQQTNEQINGQVSEQASEQAHDRAIKSIGCVRMQRSFFLNKIKENKKKNRIHCTVCRCPADCCFKLFEKYIA